MKWLRFPYAAALLILGLAACANPTVPGLPEDENKEEKKSDEEQPKGGFNLPADGDIIFLV